VMYEAITGERPFKGDNYASIISKLLGSEPVSISDLKPDTPFLLVRLIHRCLEKTRRRRFQSMTEVRVILEEIKAAVEAGISMDPQSADRIFHGRKKIDWPKVIVPAGFVTAVAVILGYLFVFGLKGESPYKVDNFAFSKLSQSNDVVFASVSPDGRSVAYNTIDSNGNRSLWIRLVEDKAALKLMDAEDAHYWGGLTFSNDGSHIYFITAKKDAKRGTMYRISTLGGKARKLVENVNDLGSVSPDGSRILFVRYLDKMQLMSADAADGGKEKALLTGGPDVKYRDPQYSHDGTSIYFIKFRQDRGEEYWSLVEIPAEGGDERVIIKEQEPNLNDIVVLKDGSGLLMNAVDPQSNLAQLYYVSPADGAMTRITNDLNIYFGISVSEDGKTIVAAQRVDAKDMWVGEGNRLSEYQRVTSEPTFYVSLAWTPDGRILYDSVDNNRPHVWIMNADGTSRQQLTPDSSNDQKPVASADGKYVYFVSDRTGENKVWRMDIDGTSPKLLIDVAGATDDPAVGPDGDTLYFTWTRKDRKVIAKLQISTGAVTDFEPYRDDRWTLSPDGKKFAYRIYDSEKEGYKVAVRSLISNTPERILNISPMDILEWTSDGQGLLYMDFESGESTHTTIWRISEAGGDPSPFITSGVEMMYRLAIAGDGRRNAVVTRRLLTDAVMLTRRN
jgi:Tol biopolymer transport system component